MAEPHKSVSVGLIGCGAVAEHYYAPALMKLAATNLIDVAALFDPSAARLARLKAIFPAAATIDRLTDFTELSGLGVDLAIIASPVVYHAKQTIEAIQCGCSVLCEKPMAASVSECQSMIDAAAKYGKVMAIGHVRRFFPALRAIKEILERNLLGKVKSFEFNEGGPFQWPATSASLFSKGQGGVLMDLGVHMIDLICWWFGEPLTIDYADDTMGGAEANCQLRLDYDSGLVGQVRLSRDWRLDNHYNIECDKGRIVWKVLQPGILDVVADDNGSFGHIAEVLAKHGCAVEHMIESGGDDQSIYFLQQLKAVVSAAGGVDNTGASTGSIVSGEAAIKSLKLIERCYAGSKLLEMPWLTKRELIRAEELHEVTRRGRSRATPTEATPAKDKRDAE